MPDDHAPTPAVAVKGYRRGPVRLIRRTVRKAWADSIFGMAAQAAFWATLSLPPLLLGLLGSIGFVGTWFGPRTPAIVESKILTFCRSVFSPAVVDEIIAPTVTDVLNQGRSELISVGFVLSLWAGSSAVSSFVDSIVMAHGQQNHRHPVWQRLVALLLYVLALVLSVFILPLVAIGPGLLTERFPAAWRDTADVLVRTFYYPGVALLLILGLTGLYKLALPRPLPWHRLLGGAVLAGLVFVTASTGLRRYLGWITSTGYSYGALAAPIAYLLFAFFLGFAVVLGAEFNASVQELWPARSTRLEILRAQMVTEAGGVATALVRTGPMTGPLSAQVIRLGRRVPALRAARHTPSLVSARHADPRPTPAQPSPGRRP